LVGKLVGYWGEEKVDWMGNWWVDWLVVKWVEMKDAMKVGLLVGWMADLLGTKLVQWLAE